MDEMCIFQMEYLEKYHAIWNASAFCTINAVPARSVNSQFSGILNIKKHSDYESTIIPEAKYSKSYMIYSLRVE